MDYSVPQRRVNTKELLERYSAREIGEDALLKDFACAEFYYSTADINLYSGDQEKSSDYLPVFASREDCIKYYEKYGQKDPVIVKKTFLSLIESTLQTNEGRTTLKLGLVVEPEKYNIKYEQSELIPVYFRILRENDNFLHYKKAYLAAGIIFSVLLVLCIGLIFVFRNIISELRPDCETARASVINVDTKKDKVKITSRGKTYVLHGVSDGNIWSYSSKQINGEQITVFIANGKAYADYASLQHASTIFGRLLVIDYVVIVILIFLTPLYFSGFYEAKRREKIYLQKIHGWSDTEE